MEINLQNPAPPAIQDIADAITKPLKNAEQVKLLEQLDQMKQPAPSQEANRYELPTKQAEMLAETLKQHGLKPTPENLQLLAKMQDDGVPLTKENIAGFYQAVKMTGDTKGAVFLLQNQIDLTPKNLALLKSLSEGGGKIIEQLQVLMDSVAKLPESLKGEILKLLGQEQPAAKPALAGQPATAAKLPLGEPAAQPQAPQGEIAAAKPAAQPISAGAAFLAGLANLTKLTSAPAQTAATGEPAPLPQGEAAVAKPVASPAASPTASQSLSGGTASQGAAQPAIASEPVASQGEASPVKLPPGGLAAQGETVTKPAPPQGEAPAAKLPLPGELPQQPLPQSNVLDALSARPSLAANMEPSALTWQNFFTNSSSPLFFPLEKSTVAELENYLNNLKNLLLTAAARLQNVNSPAAGRVLQALQTLSEHIDFTAGLRNQLFLQLPIVIGEQVFNTALYVNKEGKGQSGKKNKETSSALIALDTAFIGHFETYVQKKGSGVHCQFRLDNEDIEQLVRGNIHKLDELLKQHGYGLDSFTFVVGKEPFTLLDSIEENYAAIKPDTVFDAKA